MKRALTAVLSLGIIVFVAGALPRALQYVERRRAIAEQQNVVLPPAERLEQRMSSSRSSFSSLSSSSVRSADTLKPAVNWDVPFTVQAPLANWDEVHEEACEEASVLMVLTYFRGKTFASAEDANREIDEILASNESLGFPVDDTAEQVVALLHHEDPSLTAVLLQHPTVDDLKKALSEGKLVIVPAAGQQLGNPYFTAPGPRYHMLVLRGYTQDGYVITNDPGTKRGKEYAYSWNVLMDAIHDWNGGDVENGAKVVVVVSK